MNTATDTMIVQLPEHVANQIAAGEVVQRPASVVKELMENGLDAGARRIVVELKDAGRNRIVVADDGAGMNASDAQACFGRHATSKLRSTEDLLSLATMGFRGEALASIASIARVELRTRRPEDEEGTEVVMEGGELQSSEPVVCEPGTRMTVKRLFYNVPARRNFLKSDQVELRHCIDEFQRVALAHAELSFVLRHNGSELFDLPAGSLRQRIVRIFGGKYDERLVPVEERTDVVGLQGFVGKPEFARRTRGEQFLFVNGRFIRHGAFHGAVMRAMEGLLTPGQFPLYVLFMEVDPSRVDVNIHPTKVEAKFQEDRAIVAILQAAVKRALGRFHVAPSLDFDTETAFDIAPPKPGQEVGEPQIQLDPDYNPFNVPAGNAGAGPVRSSSSHAGSTSHGRTPAFRHDQDSERIAATRRFFESAPAQAPDDAPARLVFSEIKAPEEAPLPTMGGGFDDQRPLFQLFGGWIVTATRSGLVLVDQHRAHTRILYERFSSMAQQTATGHAQQLLFPAALEVGPADCALLASAIPALSGLGFNIEMTDDPGTLRVLGLPSDAAEGDPAALVDAVLEELREAGEVDAELRASRAMAGVARGAAIPSGRTLTRAEMLDVVDGLFACQEPDRDPWGRATLATFDREAVAARFR
ncbi:MAG: DNA mismatch repair endonuclease MutL [Flavobacteriales bacterium]|nr:DNA mismatch repair endonuclease MutL [Flavobacteriales bacterium]